MADPKIPIEANASSWSDGQLFDYLHSRFGDGHKPRSLAECALMQDYEEMKRKGHPHAD